MAEAEDHDPPDATIIAVSNQKGGEGKTTTAVNLAASLAASERRVLEVDLDPQGNASSSVGYARDEVRVGATELPTLSVIPASADLTGAEIELVGAEHRESVLRRALLRGEARSRWDFIIFDCPPSLGLLTLNALVAADAVLIPMQARYFSLEGLGALHGTIDAIRNSFNPNLVIEGIVFCMFDQRTNLAKQVVAEVEKHFPQYVFDTRIPQNIRLSESPSFGKPALLYDIGSKGAVAYLDLAEELLQRMEARLPASAEGSTSSDRRNPDSDPDKEARSPA